MNKRVELVRRTEANGISVEAVVTGDAAQEVTLSLSEGAAILGTISGLPEEQLVGISVNDTTLGTAVANLGWDEVRFPAPLFHGDTIRVETEVLALRESRSRKNNGIVIFEHRAYNQHDMLVGTCKRTALMLKRT